MGLGNSSLCALLYAREHGASFKKVLTVGRQGYNDLAYTSMLKVIAEYNAPRTKKIPLPPKPVDLYEFGKHAVAWSDELFKCLGAETVDSIDYSDYEGASIIHDMNLPINEEQKNKYSLIFDGGCLEHVFNYPVALKNCMDMLAADGFFILETPSNNWFGHGFYQFSPELFFSLLTEENGFSGTKIFIHDKKFRWYGIAPPLEIKERTELCLTKEPLLLCVISKKTGMVPPVLKVLQSDYVSIWEASDSNTGEEVSQNSVKSKLVSLYKKYIPLFLRGFIFRIRYSFKKKQLLKKFYKPVKMF